jgi:hypothetical protein
MLQDLRAELARYDWSERDTPPAVDYRLFFEGNTQEESIAPNQWGFGRPGIAQMHERFRQIAARPEVERVLVSLHFDWTEPEFADDFPPADTVLIFSSAKPDEVERWVDGLAHDGVLAGWPQGKPKNAPDPSPGVRIHCVVWD